MEREYRKHLEELYINEQLHSGVYHVLARDEKDRSLKDILEKLSYLEHRDIELWGRLLEVNSIKMPEVRMRLTILLMRALRKILGLAMTVKIIGYRESVLYDHLRSTTNIFKAKSDEGIIIRKIERNVLENEGPLERKIIEYSPVLNNIRDVTMGMYDGIIEVLAATVGIAAVLQAPLLILLSGFIVAMSGTLSMVGSTYLSVEYEKSLSLHGQGRSPKKSATYTGLLYFMGSMCPLIPFMLGIGGYAGAAIAVVIATAVLMVVSTLISIASGTSIKDRMAKSLVISLGIATVTTVIGTVARTALHII
jgi:VIT1/CCC1 family predicted Fe2+/Mn2+ transporter